MRPTPLTTVSFPYDNGLRGVGDSTLLTRVLSRAQPHFWSNTMDLDLNPVPDPDTVVPLLPEELRVVHCGNRYINVEVVAEDDASIVVVTLGLGGGTITTASTSYAEAKALGEDVSHRIQCAYRFADDDTALTLWYSSNRRALSTEARVSLPGWDDIAQNYPCPTRSDVARLAGLRLTHKARPSGRLILWHGQPGTGKTWALRALIHSWSEWCQPELITDPEAAFSNADYLFTVLRRRCSRPWRLLIIEDADKFLRADVRLRDNPALDRLLNVTDGLLGQSHRVLVLLTTNSQLSSLHPAIVRPGRCMALTEFQPFTTSAAQDWLQGGGDPPDSGATLAELFTLRGDLVSTVPVSSHGFGQYL